MDPVQLTLLAAIVAGAVATIIRPSPTIGATIVLCGAIALVATIVLASSQRRHSVEGTSGDNIELTPAEAYGRELFAENCAGCHVLGSANAVGRLGPSLDFLRPPEAVVRRTIDDGSQASWAVMPADLVTGKDADDVASFVSKVAGR
jgi:hypothetical protein